MNYNLNDLMSYQDLLQLAEHMLFKFIQNTDLTFEKKQAKDMKSSCAIMSSGNTSIPLWDLNQLFNGSHTESDIKIEIEKAKAFLVSQFDNLDSFSGGLYQQEIFNFENIEKARIELSSVGTFGLDFLFNKNVLHLFPRKHDLFIKMMGIAKKY